MNILKHYQKGFGGKYVLLQYGNEQTKKDCWCTAKRYR